MVHTLEKEKAMPKLILMFKDKILNAYPLVEGSTLTIGRHPDNDIIIDNRAVSSHHARVEHRGGEIELIDLESKNGTQLNGKQVTQCILNNKDTVTIGKHDLRADWTDTMNVEKSDELQSQLAGELDQNQTMILQSHRPARDSLTFISGGHGEFTLGQKQISFGGSPESDIPISGFWAIFSGNPAAVITKQAGDYFLRYTGGMLKPKHNGASVKGTVKLNHEDIVAIGPIKVKVQLSEKLAA